MNKCPRCNNEIYLISTTQEIYRYNEENKAWIEIEKIYKGHQYICNSCLQPIDKTQLGD